MKIIKNFKMWLEKRREEKREIEKRDDVAFIARGGFEYEYKNIHGKTIRVIEGSDS